MKNKYSVGGWLNYVKDYPYSMLPERVGVRLNPHDGMHIFIKGKQDKVGYFKMDDPKKDLISYISSELHSSGEWQLLASNLYEPIINLDYRISLGKIEKDFLRAYVKLWGDEQEIIGFTKRSFDSSRKKCYLEKSIRCEEFPLRIVENIPNNKFCAMEFNRMYTLQELGLFDEDDDWHRVHLCKDGDVWKVGEFDKEDD